jgi:hypothetical protein
MTNAADDLKLAIRLAKAREAESRAAGISYFERKKHRTGSAIGYSKV